MSFTFLRMLAIVISGATGALSLCSTLTVTIASYYESVAYAPPWDVLKPIVPPNTKGGGSYGTASGHLGSGPSYVDWSGFGVALSTVAWAPSNHGSGLALDPLVQTQAQDSISGTINALPPGYENQANMTYYFYIRSTPSNVPTLLPDKAFHVDVSGSAVADGAATAQATLALGGFLFDSINVGASSGTGKSDHDSFEFNRYLPAYTNTLYEVDMHTGANVYGTTAGTNSAFAMIDPVLTIADQYQSTYQILLSPNLAELAGPPTAAPEPRASWIFLVLLSGVAWNRWSLRKHRIARTQV